MALPDSNPVEHTHRPPSDPDPPDAQFFFQNDVELIQSMLPIDPDKPPRLLCWMYNTVSQVLSHEPLALHAWLELLKGCDHDEDSWLWMVGDEREVDNALSSISRSLHEGLSDEDWLRADTALRNRLFLMYRSTKTGRTPFEWRHRVRLRCCFEARVQAVAWRIMTSSAVEYGDLQRGFLPLTGWDTIMIWRSPVLGRSYNHPHPLDGEDDPLPRFIACMERTEHTCHRGLDKWDRCFLRDWLNFMDPLEDRDTVEVVSLRRNECQVCLRECESDLIFNNLKLFTPDIQIWDVLFVTIFRAIPSYEPHIRLRRVIDAVYSKFFGQMHEGDWETIGVRLHQHLRSVGRDTRYLPWLNVYPCHWQWKLRNLSLEDWNYTRLIRTGSYRKLGSTPPERIDQRQDRPDLRTLVGLLVWLAVAAAEKDEAERHERWFDIAQNIIRGLNWTDLPPYSSPPAESKYYKAIQDSGHTCYESILYGGDVLDLFVFVMTYVKNGDELEVPGVHLGYGYGCDICSGRRTTQVSQPSAIESSPASPSPCTSHPDEPEVLNGVENGEETTRAVQTQIPQIDEDHLWSVNGLVSSDPPKEWSERGQVPSMGVVSGSAQYEDAISTLHGRSDYPVQAHHAPPQPLPFDPLQMPNNHEPHGRRSIDRTEFHSYFGDRAAQMGNNSSLPVHGPTASGLLQGWFTQNEATATSAANVSEQPSRANIVPDAPPHWPGFNAGFADSFTFSEAFDFHTMRVTEPSNASGQGGPIIPPGTVAQPGETLPLFHDEDVTATAVENEVPQQENLSAFPNLLEHSTQYAPSSLVTDPRSVGELTDDIDDFAYYRHNEKLRETTHTVQADVVSMSQAIPEGLQIMDREPTMPLVPEMKHLHDQPPGRFYSSHAGQIDGSGRSNDEHADEGNVQRSHEEDAPEYPTGSGRDGAQARQLDFIPYLPSLNPLAFQTLVGRDDPDSGGKAHRPGDTIKHVSAVYHADTITVEDMGPSEKINAIKEYLLLNLRKIGVPQPKKPILRNPLPWKTMRYVIEEQGYDIVNWPADVPVPGSGGRKVDDNKGLIGLRAGHLEDLYRAVTCPDVEKRLTFKPSATATSSRAALDSSTGGLLTFDGPEPVADGSGQNIQKRPNEGDTFASHQSRRKRRRNMTPSDFR